ncbi:MAG TPA: imidazole glycerol phosphate synthase subunit HisH [Candidatus Binatia bacterium]|nr:imidazole glycerol phosphate synthase subunit HisH [Candidatus Binatia bacterium]
MPTIAIVDYGVGNLRSVERALSRAGAAALITPDPDAVTGADGVLLPGVGAFAPAAAMLRSTDLGAAVVEAAHRGRPVLGICLGFQLLFVESDEGEGGAGLGLIPGRVTRISASGLKIPHMGWNRLRLRQPDPLLEGVDDGAWCYFVHSYAAQAASADVVATTDYGGEIAAVCRRGTVAGTQFHPEKSGAAGLRMYANWVAACNQGRVSAGPPLAGGQIPAGPPPA